MRLNGLFSSDLVSSCKLIPLGPIFFISPDNLSVLSFVVRIHPKVKLRLKYINADSRVGNMAQIA